MEQTTSTEWKSEYSNMSKNEFKALILIDKEKKKRYFVYFILNTFYQSFYNSDWYCYCDNFKDNSKCKIYTILLKFPNFEDDIKKNMFNLDFLNNYYEKMCDELLQMFDQRKDAIEHFQGEYVFSGRDWHTDE